VQDAQNFVEDKTGTSGADVLVVTTDGATYDTGKPVNITAKNIDDKKLAFPDSSLGLETENAAGGQKYSSISAQV
jgi:hypothetical protein